MQRLLLLVAIHNIHQFPKLMLHVWVFLVEYGLELLHDLEPGLFQKSDVVGFLEEWNIFGLLGHQEVESIAASCYTSGSSYPVDVLLDFAREIIIDDPVDAFEIKTPGCDICTNEQTVFFLIEAKIAHFSRLVVHVTMQLENSALEHVSGGVFFVVRSCLSFFPSAPSTSVPVKNREELMQKVDLLAVADEYNDLALK